MIKTPYVLILCFLFSYPAAIAQNNNSAIPRGKPFVIRSENTSLSSGRSGSLLKNLVQLKNEDDLRLVSEKTNPPGFHQQKYQQYNKGIPVEYGTVSVSASRGAIRTISGEVYDIPENLAPTPSIAERVALDAALKHIGAKQYAWETAEMALKRGKTGNARHFPKGELVYVNVYLPGGQREKGDMTLAYKFDIYAKEPLSRNFVYVDASYGAVIHKNAIIKHADEGTAHTRYSGVKAISTTHDASLNKYVLKDDSRGQGIETYNLKNGTDYVNADNFADADNNWTPGEFDNAAKDNIALDAHWGAQRTFDYFFTKHGRNSYDDNGTKIKSYVHYGDNYVNAFWNGSEMTYGDGDDEVDPLTSLDICAHEIGHAVCSSTADLVYMNEPGALNESLSDIWGATIEHYAAPEKNPWDMGEDIHFIIRSLSNPNEHQQPDTYGGSFWYEGPADNGGVHINSGVMNHWYHILVTGKSGINDHDVSYNVQGIGFDAASSIVYRMETMYLTANSQYADARNAAIYAAIDLFGEGSNEVTQTRNAWTAVGLYETLFAPSQLTAMVTSPVTVELSWQDNAPNETSIIIERSSSFNNGFQILKTLEQNTTAYTDTGVPSGIHYYRVRAIVDNNSTESSNKATAAIGVSPLIQSDTEVSVCNKIFLDHGGFENYTGDKAITMVVHPAEAGKKVKVSFSSFALSKGEWYFDGLLIYDGADVNAPGVGTYTQSTLPPDILATNPSGALTFRFISNDDTNGFGWQAYLSCEVAPEPPANLSAEVLNKQVTLTWTDVAAIETGYRIERKNSSEFSAFQEVATVPANTTSYTDHVQTSDRYTYRIFSLKDDLRSSSSNTADATIGTPFIMKDGTYAICNSQFLDPGEYGHYPQSNRTVTTLAPMEPGTSVVASFQEFNIDGFRDFLFIYDGGSVDAPLLTYFTGRLISPIPAVVYPTNPDGKLTFEFVSDDQVQMHGWKADITCITQPAAPTNLVVTSAGAGQVHLTWADNANDETGYVIERASGEIFIILETVDANTQAYEDVNLVANRKYTYRVRAVKETSNAKISSPHSNTGSVTFGIPPVFMKKGELTACNKSLFDSGIDEDYSNNENYTLTIVPETPGEKVMIAFTSFDLEEGYDFLWIYDGDDTTAPLLGVYTGNSLPPSATASNADGKLTFRFVSDLLVTGDGWEATIFCGTPLVAPDNLIAHAAGSNQINLAWEDHEPNETGYVVERATGSVFTTVAALGPDTESYEDTDLIENRKYTYRVRAIRNGVISHPSNTAFVIIGTAPIIMHQGTVSTCNSVFLDPGGDENHGYGNHTLTIGSDEPGKQLSVNFTLFDLSEFYTVENYLEVFNGTGTNPENSLGKVSADNLTFYSANAEGKLTFKFSAVAEEIVTAGWEANITCVTKAQPEIVLEDRTELYFDFGVSYYRGYSYKGAQFTYEIVDDGSNTGELRLDPVPEQNWIGLFTLKTGTVKVKASVPETEYYQAAEKIATITIIRRTPFIILSNADASFGSESLTLNARDFYNTNLDFKYEVVNDRSNTAEVQLSGAGNKVVTFRKAGIVKIKCFVEGNDFYGAAEKIITVTIRKEIPVVGFPDLASAYGSAPFDLNATAYKGASFQYNVIENTEAVLLSGSGNKTVTVQDVGEVKLQAFAAESGGYYSAAQVSTLTIGKANQWIEFSQIPDVLHTASPFALTASSSSGLPVLFTVESGPATVSGNMLSLTGETGAVRVVASQQGNDHYHPASLTRDFAVDLATNIGDDPVQNSIHVWPNPAAKSLHVESGIYEMEDITLTDVIGRPVIRTEGVTMKNELDVSSLGEGMYLLSIRVKNNRLIIRKVQVVR